MRGLGKEIRLDVWIEGWRRLEVGLIWEKVLCVLRYAVKRAVVPRNNAHAQASQKERDVCAVRYTHTPVLDTTRNCNEKNSLTLQQWDQPAVKLDLMRFIAKLLRITDSY